jgi:hypothetical protein
MGKARPRQLMVELLKANNKEKILKAVRRCVWGRHITYRGTKIRMAADFLSEVMQARTLGRHIFKGRNGGRIGRKEGRKVERKEELLQPSILDLAKSNHSKMAK